MWWIKIIGKLVNCNWLFGDKRYDMNVGIYLCLNLKSINYFLFYYIVFYVGLDWSWYDKDDGGVGNVGIVILVRDSGGVFVCID